MVRARVVAVLSSLLVVLSALPAAAAKPRVEWAEVVVREGADEKRLAKALTKLLQKATKRADWGKGKKKVRLRAKLTRLDWQEGDEVLRLTVTIVARIEGGSTARSHLRIGGHPRERRKLERDAMRIVADGLVTRLAELSRRNTD